MRTPAWLEEMERAFCLLMSRMDDGCSWPAEADAKRTV